jgi:hypothetical protein
MIAWLRDEALGDEQRPPTRSRVDILVAVRTAGSQIARA